MTVIVAETLKLTHYQTTNFRLFQTERVCNSNNFKLDENGRKLSKWVENTVGKGEIACYEQFLLFPQCFQKPSLAGASKGVIVWEWVNVNNLCMGIWGCIFNIEIERNILVHVS